MYVADDARCSLMVWSFTVETAHQCSLRRANAPMSIRLSLVMKTRAETSVGAKACGGSTRIPGISELISEFKDSI